MPHDNVAGSRGVLRWSRAVQRAVLQPLLRVVLPGTCFGCGRPLGAVQYLGACGDCWSRLRPLRGPLCPSCGLERPEGTDLLGPARGRCGSCILSDRPLDEVRPAVAYDDLARRFLLRAKFAGRRELLIPLGQQLSRVLHHAGFASDSSCVVAVPSHPWALLRRGFNPALEIARVVAGTLGLPLLRWALTRRLGAAAAKRLTATQRRGLANAFRSRRPLGGQRVLLIDDVLTTGATAEGCATALRAAGASKVRLAVWARTPHRASVDSRG